MACIYRSDWAGVGELMLTWKFGREGSGKGQASEGVEASSVSVRTICYRSGSTVTTVAMGEAGTGPSMVLLPALSSISTRVEMCPLFDRLAPEFRVSTVDWPGFGDLPRGRVDWSPEMLSAFLDWFLSEIALHRPTSSWRPVTRPLMPCITPPFGPARWNDCVRQIGGCDRCGFEPARRRVCARTGGLRHGPRRRLSGVTWFPPLPARTASGRGQQRQIRGSVPSLVARVLEVRIHLPPAVSLRTFGSGGGLPPRDDIVLDAFLGTSDGFETAAN
jgi:hypothetical protein